MCYRLFLQKYSYFCVDFKETILEPWTCETPSSLAILSQFSAVIPPPGRMLTRPAAYAISSLRCETVAVMDCDKGPP